MKYFSNATLARCTQVPSENQFTLRGGICGIATNATPPSPKSARQTAFQVASLSAGRPFNSAWMLSTVAVTMDSIIYPVLGVPVGIGVASTCLLYTSDAADDLT